MYNMIVYFRNVFNQDTEYAVASKGAAGGLRAMIRSCLIDPENHLEVLRTITGIYAIKHTHQLCRHTILTMIKEWKVLDEKIWEIKPEQQGYVLDIEEFAKDIPDVQAREANIKAWMASSMSNMQSPSS